MRAKKSYGQHFLTNHHLAESIAQSLTRTDEYTDVLEVGPGKAMLTQYLLEQPFHLNVVEADRDMVAYLKDHYPQLAGKIIAEDFLKLHLDTLFDGRPFALIGNFPYNISSQILIRLVENRDRIPELVGMFQKELADRVIAPPGSKTYGAISVVVQAYYEGKTIFSVSPGNFSPPPKVKSSVIRLLRREEPHLQCDEKLFRQIVKQAFMLRRKMLRNSMKAFIKGDPILSDPFFEQRPERLSVADFVKLTRWVQERIANH